MDSCKKCGCKTFSTIYSMSVDLRLENGVLTAFDEEDLGDSGIYSCVECETEYQAKDFLDILYR